MPRGRRRKETISILETYTNELDRLTMLEEEAVLNLNKLRENIVEIKEKIREEELKELQSIMEEKQVSIEEIKQMILNKNSETKDETKDI